MTIALAFTAGIGLGWLCYRDRLDYWRGEALAAERDLRAVQAPARRAVRHPRTAADTWRHTEIAAHSPRPKRTAAPRRTASTGRPVLPEIARLCCPIFDRPGPVNYLVRRRTHEVAV